MTATDTQTMLRTAIRQHQSGDIGAAVQIYAEVLQKDPGNADAWHLSGLAEFANGDQIHAESSLRRAIALKPDEPEFKSNLAALLVNMRRSGEAEDICRDVLRIDAGHAAALGHLGTALRQQGRLQESLKSFEAANDKGENGASLCNLGTVLADLGRVDDARDALLRASELAPKMPQVHINLGAVQRELGDIDGALQSLQTAEELTPDAYEVFVNRANLFLEVGRVLDAIEEYQKAIAINSATPSAVAGLGRALQQAGSWEESLEAQRLAAELDPDDQKYQSSYLYAASLSPLLTADAVAYRHAEWGQQLERSIEPVVAHRNDLSIDRKLRIAYVSPDLRSHATMRFLYPLLEAHDRNQFELFFYSETAVEDDATQKVKSLSDGWCATKGLRDEDLSQRIQDDRIDVLIDLAGHTSANRLPVFAHKPAPVQVSFLGYPNTTGLRRVDYFLTDRIREPHNAEDFFTETPVFMPHGACCYSAPNAPDVAPPPVLENGHITLGSTHRLEKISPQTLKLWAWVMTAIPDAKLLVFRDTLRSSELREQTQQLLLESGINTGRVRFGWELPEQHLDIYSDIDIMLDVFPWGSGTIAYDAMWMGVPIPTLPGDRGGCRATASMMHFCGLPDLVADSPESYVQVVSNLAADQDRLVELRNGTRAAMSNTVCNGQQFARDIEAEYRKMWQTYVTSVTQAPEKRR